MPIIYIYTWLTTLYIFHISCLYFHPSFRITPSLHHPSIPPSVLCPSWLLRLFMTPGLLHPSSLVPPFSVTAGWSNKEQWLVLRCWKAEMGFASHLLFTVQCFHWDQHEGLCCCWEISLDRVTSFSGLVAKAASPCTHALAVCLYWACLHDARESNMQCRKKAMLYVQTNSHHFYKMPFSLFSVKEFHTSLKRSQTTVITLLIDFCLCARFPP